VSYDDNRSLIRGLWPNAEITETMASLFRERLSRLDQEVLAEAIKAARVDSRWHTPELGEILGQYEKFRRIAAVAKPVATQHQKRPKVPEVDPAVEQRVQRDAMTVIREATLSDEECIANAIWARWEANEIGSNIACRLLTELKLKLYPGPCLSRITKDGEIVPLVAVEDPF